MDFHDERQGPSGTQNGDGQHDTDFRTGHIIITILITSPPLIKATIYIQYPLTKRSKSVIQSWKEN